MSKQRGFVCLTSTCEFHNFNKAMSLQTTIEMYECGYEGQIAYYTGTKVYLSDTYPAVEISYSH